MTGLLRSSRPGGRAATALSLLALLVFLATPTTRPATDTPLRTAAAPSSTSYAITIGTVPAVAGFPVTLDAETQMTDAAGEAHFVNRGRGSALADRVTLNEATIDVHGEHVRVTALRVYPNGTRPILALELSYQTTFNFVDTSGVAVDASAISKVVIKSESGKVVDVTPGQPVWLEGNRVVGGGGAPRSRNLSWSVQIVDYRGSNLVNASQQNFFPADQHRVQVKLLFFGLKIHVRDAFFGFPQSGRVELTYPDGHTRVLTLTSNGDLALPSLSRGYYTVRLLGPGPAFSRPLAVSRNQEIDLSFYSWLDIALLLAAVLGAAFGLAMTGRIRRRRGRKQPGRPGEPPAGGTEQDPGARGGRKDAAPGSDLEVVGERSRP